MRFAGAPSFVFAVPLAGRVPFLQSVAFDV